MHHTGNKYLILLCLTLLLALGGGAMPVLAITADGVQQPGEYPHETSFAGGDFQVYWEIQGDTLNMALVVKSAGWVAIGFSPTVKMKDADMVIGWVTREGAVTILDAYSTAETGNNHPADTDLGGSDDLLTKTGSRPLTWTTLEFSRKLATGDRYDAVIPAEGNIPVIWAYGANDNWGNVHLVRGSGALAMAGGASSQRTAPVLWPYHAIFMAIGFLLALLTLAQVLGGKGKGWFTRHRQFGLAGGGALIIGLILGILNVQLSTGIHLRPPHTWVGLAAILFTLAVLWLGLRWLGLRDAAKKKKLRPMHLWLARLDILSIIAAIVLGLFASGII